MTSKNQILQLGFDTNNPVLGNGLKNMQERMASIGGSFSIFSEKGKVLEAIQELKAGGSPMSASIARRVLSSIHLKPKNPDKADDTKDLTPKEIQVLELLAKGYINKEIADRIHTTVAMVKQHLHRIYKKLHVSNRTQALNKFFKR